jgi:hypothetical protein
VGGSYTWARNGVRTKCGTEGNSQLARHKGTFNIVFYLPTHFFRSALDKARCVSATIWPSFVVNSS